ncbi:MAG: thiol:disulfide interchange protein [Puniceicoccaceae bacterium]|nr:MAG: thiol:disulfide interchange protein [Puniceicoccaceae bacterium]
MTYMRRTYCLALAGLLLTGAPLLALGPVETDHVTAELVAEHTTIQPGKEFWVGLRLEMEHEWHTYWINPGDSGLPTTIDWTLPDGFEAGEIHWPYPEYHPLGPVASYGYEREVILMVPMKAPENLEPGTAVRLSAYTEWLACKVICLPGEAEVALNLKVSADEPEAHPVWFERFARAREEWPLKVEDWSARAVRSDNRFQLAVDLPEDFSGEVEALRFFPYEEGLADPVAPQNPRLIEGRLQLDLPISGFFTGEVDAIRGVLVSETGFGESLPRRAVELNFELGEDLEAAAAGGLGGIDLGVGFLVAIGFAFVGGLILNLMPCVFPILSIKIFSFVQHSGHVQSRMARHGGVFGLGVLVSFWVLAGLLIALRAGGAELGWGYQLQSPAFIIFIAGLLFLLSLMLMGVFEFGGSLIGLAGKTSGSGYSGSFLTGVLATIVATPCTAPFMGAALAYALTQPALNSLLVFTALGLGMATPYMLLSSFPALLKFLPKPGPWMETFKQFMAFPLLATVIWLVWVLGQQVGVDGLLYFFGGLLLVSMGAWVLGRWATPVRVRRVRLIGQAVAVALLIGGGYVAYGATQFEPTVGATAGGGAVQWEEFHPDKVREHLAAGRPVFIDFTAAWCLTCKANELVVFRSADVRERIEQMDVALLKADWTNRNPMITQALASYGRTGVPLYVLYSGKPGEQPQILPELINPTIVLNALERIADPS